MVLVNLPTTLVSKGLTSLQVLRRKEYSRVRCDYEGQVPGVNENVTIFRYDEFEITYMFSRPLRYVYVWVVSNYENRCLVRDSSFPYRIR